MSWPRAAFEVEFVDSWGVEEEPLDNLTESLDHFHLCPKPHKCLNSLHWESKVPIGRVKESTRVCIRKIAEELKGKEGFRVGSGSIL